MVSYDHILFPKTDVYLHDLHYIQLHISGLTLPLVTTEEGDKFGKSAGNAIWLDPKKTSPYSLYQFFIRTKDSEVEKLLKLFTFYSTGEIKDIMFKHKEHPEERYPQICLAEQLTTLVHGSEQYLRPYSKPHSSMSLWHCIVLFQFTQLQSSVVSYCLMLFFFRNIVIDKLGLLILLLLNTFTNIFRGRFGPCTKSDRGDIQQRREVSRLTQQHRVRAGIRKCDSYYPAAYTRHHCARAGNESTMLPY